MTFKAKTIDIPIKNVVCPENLMLLREFCRENSLFSPLFQNLFQMDIILDTNVIISDILWLATKRKNPDARPSLLETIVCGTLKAYAPDFLLEELNKHLPRLAAERGIPLETLNEYWEKYKLHIKLMAVEEATEEEIAQAQDPNDLPYIKLQQKIGAKIYTKDKDIAAMQGEITSKAIIIALHKYSYHATVEYSIKFMGASSIVITQKTIEGVVVLLKALSERAQKLPPWVLGGAALLVMLAVAHPKSRAAFMKWISQFPKDRFGEGFIALMEISMALADKHCQAQAEAKKILEESSLQTAEGTAA
jgi:predicted nucleic acid-binding protein